MLLPRRKVPLDAFLPHVMAVVQGDSRPELPKNAALSYIRNAAIEFAQETRVITRTASFKAQECLTCYPLVDPECEVIYIIDSVEVDGCPVYDYSFDDQQLMFGCGVAGEEITVKASVKPSRRCCEVDERLYEDHHDAIVNLALSEVHLMPQQPWTSGGASQARRRQASMHMNSEIEKRLKKGVVPHQKVSRNYGYL